MTTNPDNCDLNKLISRYSDILSSETYSADRKAKREAFRVLALSLLGTLKPAFYLCGLDIGMGKSTLILTFLRLWKEMGFMPHGSVIICLSRLDEIERFTFACGLDKADYAVVSTDKKLNRYGAGMEGAGFAPVLFTTQQMVEAQAKGVESFADIEAFHYLGQPRTTRIWDESLHEFKDVTIPLDAVTALPFALRSSFPIEMTALEAFLSTVHGLAVGDSVTVPESLSERLKASLPWKLLATLPISKAQQEAIVALASMGGSVVTLQVGMKGQHGLIGARRVLPADFMPAVVFDASARLRTGYAMRERYAGNVIRLKSATHDYAPLTVRHWGLSMGRDNRADPAHRMLYLAVVAELINSQPGTPFLIVHHQTKEGQASIEAELAPMLDDPAQAHFLHWGIHQGANEFRHIKKIIVLGLWQKPAWVYDALYMAASGLGYHGIDQDELNALRWGEHMHDLLQGVGRTNVRNGNDGRSGEAEAYIVTRGGAKMEAAILATFPGASLEAWQPVVRSPKGQMQKVQSYLIAAFADPFVSSVSKQAVQEAVGISTSQGLRRITKDERMKAFLVGMGLEAKLRSIVRLSVATSLMPMIHTPNEPDN